MKCVMVILALFFGKISIAAGYFYASPQVFRHKDEHDAEYLATLRYNVDHQLTFSLVIRENGNFSTTGFLRNIDQLKREPYVQYKSIAELESQFILPFQFQNAPKTENTPFGWLFWVMRPLLDLDLKLLQENIHERQFHFTQIKKVWRTADLQKEIQVIYTVSEEGSRYVVTEVMTKRLLYEQCLRLALDDFSVTSRYYLNEENRKVDQFNSTIQLGRCGSKGWDEEVNFDLKFLNFTPSYMNLSVTPLH